MAKKVTWKTSDSCASTPSVTGINDYLQPGEELVLKPTQNDSVSPVEEEATRPPMPLHPVNIMFADPIVENTVARIHAPKRKDELDEGFEKCCNTALCFDQNYTIEVGAKVEQNMNNLDLFTTRSKGAEDPWNNDGQMVVHVPMAEKFTN